MGGMIAMKLAALQPRSVGIGKDEIAVFHSLVQASVPVPNGTGRRNRVVDPAHWVSLCVKKKLDKAFM